MHSKAVFICILVIFISLSALAFLLLLCLKLYRLLKAYDEDKLGLPTHIVFQSDVNRSYRSNSKSKSNRTIKVPNNSFRSKVKSQRKSLPTILERTVSMDEDLDGLEVHIGPTSSSCPPVVVVGGYDSRRDTCRNLAQADYENQNVFGLSTAKLDRRYLVEMS